LVNQLYARPCPFADRVSELIQKAPIFQPCYIPQQPGRRCLRNGAAAVAAFQQPDDAGCAVFYAAEKYSTAVAVPEDDLTLFTGSLVATIARGIVGGAARIWA